MASHLIYDRNQWDVLGCFTKRCLELESNYLPLLLQASLGLQVLSLPVSVRVHVCVCLCVYRSHVCPRDNSSPIQARITKFRSEMQNTLIKIPSVQSKLYVITNMYCQNQGWSHSSSGVKWDKCLLITRMSCWVQVFCLILDSLVSFHWTQYSICCWVGFWNIQVWILTSEEDNLSPFNTKSLPCVNTQFELNNIYVLLRKWNLFSVMLVLMG